MDVVRSFKCNWTEEIAPKAIEKACRDSGMKWYESMLQPVTTVQLFFLQILHGNTACSHLPHLARMTFSGAAYCKARMRIALNVFVMLLKRSVDRLSQDVADTGLWLGHRVFFVDGSSFSMPDTPALQKEFGQPGKQKPGCGFPVAHWLAMMHAGTGMIVKMLASPLRTNDLSKMPELHPELHQNDVLVGDRAFCSFAHLALLLQRGVHGVLRIHQRTIVDFTPHREHVVPGTGKASRKKGKPRSRWQRALGVTDQLVEWFKPVACPRWMTQEQFALLPASLTVRELRYAITRNGFRVKQVMLVTTLLDEHRYQAAELAELFRKRWEIETNFGHLKTTMKMDILKCETVEGVLKELHVFALIYNLVRQVMLAAAARQSVDVNRISFIDAVRWLQSAMPGDILVRLVVNPRRPNRQEPRVRKRRPKNYPLMTKPRKKLQEQLQQ
jgi:hypothetical protein